MAKLTENQLIVLSAAAARDDGIAIAPEKMNKAAASKVGSSLIARKLMREARSKSGMPIWRVDKDDRPISLVITRAGRNAIGIDEDAAADAPRMRASPAGRLSVWGTGNVWLTTQCQPKRSRTEIPC